MRGRKTSLVIVLTDAERVELERFDHEPIPSNRLPASYEVRRSPVPDESP